MSNPPKQKGTRGETELRRVLEDLTGRNFRRTTPTTRWDLETSDDRDPVAVVRILATRPDHGNWLLSLPVVDWTLPWWSQATTIRVEVKRYKSFRHHSIWKEKFE